MKVIRFILFVALALILGGCIITERERRGVSTVPFNSPPANEGRHTFDGER